MRIAIDAHSIGTGLAGNETYAVNIVESLAEITGRDPFTVYVTKRAAAERLDGRWSGVNIRRIVPHTPFVRIPLALSYELRRRPVDVLLVQYTAPPLSPCRVVAVIHDISFEHLPETFTRRGRFQMKLTIRQTARTAARVIVPSDFSRGDLIDTYKLSPDRVTTIPLAASPIYRPIDDKASLDAVAARYGLKRPFILAVGSIQPRKNLARLLQAYSAFRAGRRDAPDLVIVGGRGWLSDDIFNTVEKKGLKDSIVFTGYVPDEDLPYLYNAAMCFVYPSIFEGFGLPPLEAMQCGTPVITSARTSMPEVAGDAAILVDPFDVDAIGSALERVLGDEHLRSEMRTKGLVQAAKFSWEKTARATLDVLREVAAQ